MMLSVKRRHRNISIQLNYLRSAVTGAIFVYVESLGAEITIGKARKSLSRLGADVDSPYPILEVKSSHVADGSRISDLH